MIVIAIHPIVVQIIIIKLVMIVIAIHPIVVQIIFMVVVLLFIIAVLRFTFYSHILWCYSSLIRDREFSFLRLLLGSTLHAFNFEISRIYRPEVKLAHNTSYGTLINYTRVVQKKLTSSSTSNNI